MIYSLLVIQPLVPPSSPARVRVRTSLPADLHDDSPIRIRPGERVTLTGEAGADFPAFVQIATADGGSGWVPSRYLSTDRPQATVLTGYDTTVLHVAAGDLLTLLADDHESGWAWCADDEGREGWVPYAILDGEG